MLPECQRAGCISPGKRGHMVIPPLELAQGGYFLPNMEGLHHLSIEKCCRWLATIKTIACQEGQEPGWLITTTLPSKKSSKYNFYPQGTHLFLPYNFTFLTALRGRIVWEEVTGPRSPRSEAGNSSYRWLCTWTTISGAWCAHIQCFVVFLVQEAREEFVARKGTLAGLILSLM